MTNKKALYAKAPEELIDKANEAVQEFGYNNRSDFIRDTVRLRLRSLNILEDGGEVYRNEILLDEIKELREENQSLRDRLDHLEDRLDKI